MYCIILLYYISNLQKYHMNYDYYILQKDNHAIIVSIIIIVDNKNRKTLKIGVGVYIG